MAQAMNYLEAYKMEIGLLIEGNGRVARMLSILMGLQAGLPPLDFQDMITKDKEEYLRAIQIGVGGNYAPMEKVFGDVIRKTLRARELK